MAATSRILCFGAGGHAAVVIDLLKLRARTDPISIVGMVASPDEHGEVLGIPILGADEDLARIIRDSAASHFIIGLGTIKGGALQRPRLFEAAQKAGLCPFTAIHPAAIVSETAVVGPGATVMAGAVIQARTRVGMNAIVNTHASLDHDCVIGDHVHIAPGATCSGGVEVGARAHIGAGAVVLHNVRIGEDATVGAGATVIRDCSAGATVVGVPARPLQR